MKPIFLALAVLGLTCFRSSLGFAESFDAIVTAVMAGGSGIQATVTNMSGQTKQNVMFHLLPTVDLSDYKTMDRIEPGNRIKIQAETDSSGNWQISRIEPYETRRESAF